MAELLMLLTALQLARFTHGSPNIAFPLNAQLPLAARADTFYSWSFAPNTFTSSSNISYSLGRNHPPWLSIESESRKLYGTPKDGDIEAGDVVGQKVDIVAIDDAGPTTMDATLVISRKPAPTIKIPLEEQIKTFGNYSAPSSILSYPATDFKYTFNADTFGKGSRLNYYAVSSNNSPLPSWIQFDASSVTFSGKTPPFESLVQPPQTFSFNLVASDIIGFSATPMAFHLVVGSHKLTTKDPIIYLNATKGTAVSYDGLKDAIYLDDKPVKSSDLDIATKDVPNWLSYDKVSGQISGTPGPKDHSGNFTITYSSKLSATLDVLVVVNIATGLFKSTFEDMQAHPGDKFEVDLSQHFRDPSDINLKISISPTEEWLEADGFKISGRVPQDAKGSFDIALAASSKSSSLSETENLHVMFLALDGTPTSQLTNSPTTTSTDEPSQSVSVQPGRLSAGDILLATVIPILFIALILMLLACFLRRRRASRSYLSSKTRQRNTILGGLQRISKSSIRRAERMMVIPNNERHILKPSVSAYMETTPRDYMKRKSSETLGETEKYESVLPKTVAASEHPALLQGPSLGNQDERRSWETVEGDAPFMRGAKSFRNDLTTRLNIRDSTRQVFGVADLTNGRGTALKDSNATKPSATSSTPYYGHGEQKDVDVYATKISSSLAPPINERGRFMRPSAPTITESEASDPNWESMTFSDADNVDLRQPEQAFFRADKTNNDGQRWVSNAISNDSRSLGTDPSFNSAENWRLIGKRDAVTMTFNENADDATFHPLAESHGGGRPGERSSPPPAARGKWGEVGAEKKTTIHESTSVFSNALSAWRKDDSGKMSGDSSFKAFI